MCNKLDGGKKKEGRGGGGKFMPRDVVYAFTQGIKSGEMLPEGIKSFWCEQNEIMKCMSGKEIL